VDLVARRLRAGGEGLGFYGGEETRMIDVSSKVRVYEINGADVTGHPHPTVTVHSHWNSNDRVVLELPDGMKATFMANDLEAAIKNARNSVRF
jgi:hypothetical protein